MTTSQKCINKPVVMNLSSFNASSTLVIGEPPVVLYECDTSPAPAVVSTTISCSQYASNTQQAYPTGTLTFVVTFVHGGNNSFVPNNSECSSTHKTIIMSAGTLYQARTYTVCNVRYITVKAMSNLAADNGITVAAGLPALSLEFRS